MKNIILASSSIHRKKLLKQLKISFKAISPNIDETRKRNESINNFVKRLSVEKAIKVANKVRNAIVIGSDEIAVVGNKVLGKPGTIHNAKKQLRFISGKDIVFKTGLCVVDTDSMKKFTCIVHYKIKMKKLNDIQINNYIKKENMLNCAAGIKIEGLAISLIEKTTGYDPTSIIGLPLIKLTEYLNKFGYKV